MGDLNSKHRYFGCKKFNENGHILFDISEDLELTILNDMNETTHMSPLGSTDILDMAFATQPTLSKISECYVGEDVGSDHLPLHVKLTSNINIATETEILKRCIRKLNTVAFDNAINYNLNVAPISTNIHNIDQACDNVTDTLSKALDLACPKTRVRENVWRVSNETLKLIKLERKLRRLSQKKEGSFYKVMYNYMTKRVKSAIIQEKQASWENATSSLNSQKMDKNFWQTFKSLTGTGRTKKSGREKQVLKEDGSLTTNNDEKAKAFATTLGKIHNTHEGNIFDDNFKKCVENYVNKNSTLFNPLPHPTIESGDEHESVSPISVEEIETNLKQTKNTAPGEDEITNAIIKMTPLNRLEYKFVGVADREVTKSEVL
ncbi:uncharacterized protein LOC106177719 [Lingula anatina]|uniref:Uncharacterized protein LOC106177719 n=1 Tax=Lingula anatina TaxID=7574 RepID=A0A1S3K0W3_LINAN|nr:uncharacterized protein LOC106177719 [Lingula anatina]|eukprot:XP_013416029.1 uncharacterized protein LOC106177719 [Lingula anatina]